MIDADRETAQEIKDLAHEWLDAARRRDRATLDRILADDFVIAGWQPDGVLADKQFYIADCLKPVDIQEGSYHFDEWKFRVYGEIVVVNCVLDIRALVNGYEWGGEVMVTDVWVRTQDAWRATTRHTSPIARTKKPAQQTEERRTT
ncbi:MAG TPA: nuclear transport factor 2 family protein [Pyrinomonadaceae bacterium]